MIDSLTRYQLRPPECYKLGIRIHKMAVVISRIFWLHFGTVGGSGNMSAIFISIYMLTSLCPLPLAMNTNTGASVFEKLFLSRLFWLQLEVLFKKF